MMEIGDPENSLSHCYEQSHYMTLPKNYRSVGLKIVRIDAMGCCNEPRHFMDIALNIYIAFFKML
jgi:hypothetical protein